IAVAALRVADEATRTLARRRSALVDARGGVVATAVVLLALVDVRANRTVTGEARVTSALVAHAARVGRRVLAGSVWMARRRGALAFVDAPAGAGGVGRKAPIARAGVPAVGVGAFAVCGAAAVVRLTLVHVAAA